MSVASAPTARSRVASRRWAEVERLILQYQAGDVEAGEEALRRLRPLLRRLARQWYASHTSDSEDWFQEAMIGAWEAMQRYRPGVVHPRKWLRTIVWRHLATVLEWHRRQQRSATEVSLAEPITDEHDRRTLADVLPSECSLDPEDMVLQAETAKEVLEAMQWALSPMERRALLAHAGADGYGERCAVAASWLGVQRKVVDNAVCRARSKLRRIAESMERWEPWGTTPTVAKPGPRTRWWRC